MLKIRLRRPGKSVKGRTHYKIVVAEATSPRESKFVAQIGYYNPTDKLLQIEIPEYESWIKKGAKPTETVASLFKKYKKELRVKGETEVKVTESLVKNGEDNAVQ